MIIPSPVNIIIRERNGNFQVGKQKQTKNIFGHSWNYSSPERKSFNLSFEGEGTGDNQNIYIKSI
jgi:hypothetical protein